MRVTVLHQAEASAQDPFSIGVQGIHWRLWPIFTVQQSTANISVPESRQDYA